MEFNQLSILILGIIIFIIANYFIVITLKQGRKALKEIQSINSKNK